MILEPKKIKSVTVATFPPSVCHEVMGPDAMILAFLNVEFFFFFFSFALSLQICLFGTFHIICGLFQKKFYYS